MNDELVKIAEQLRQLAPQAWGYAVQIEQVDAISFLIVSAILLIVLVVLATVAFRIGRNMYEPPEKPHDYSDDTPLIISRITAGFLMAGAIAAFLFGLCDRWAWITAFNPQMGLAKDVLVKILSVTH